MQVPSKRPHDSCREAPVIMEIARHHNGKQAPLYLTRQEKIHNRQAIKNRPKAA